MNYIFGSSGFAKEVDWLINEISQYSLNETNVYSFVSQDNIGDKINKKDVIDENTFRNHIDRYSEIKAYIGIGNPLVKEKIVNKFKEISKIKYPNLIHPSALYDQRSEKIKMGVGNILCAGTILTTDITIGHYVHLNLGVTVGHDTIIGDYTTVSPGVHISGKVIIGKNIFIGTGAVILENLNICDNVIIGAGAVVARNIEEPGTYIGIPAKKKT